jgi:hypothetical protein
VQDYLTSYSTIGSSDVALPSQWRMLGPLESIIGVLMAGISVSILFAIVMRLSDAHVTDRSRAFAWRESSLVHRRYSVQNDPGGRFLPQGRVDHEVEIVPRRPFDFEILFDKLRAILINRFHQLHGFFLAFALPLEPTHLFLEWCIDENVECVGPVPQIIGAATSDDNRIALLGGGPHKLFRALADAFRVCQLYARPGLGHSSFEAASHKGFEKAVVERISALLALFDVALIAPELSRDPLRQHLAPQFPLQPLGDRIGDFGRAASVLALECHNSDHELPS